MMKELLKSKITFYVLIIVLGTLVFSCKQEKTKQNKKNEVVTEYISFQNELHSFALTESGKTPVIVANSNDHSGLPRILNYFKTDIKNVSGIDAQIVFDEIPEQEEIIIVGTLGKSSIINQLVESKKINVSDVTGKWETSLIQVVENPFKGVKKALVIVGSDKRGTFYGVFDVSRKMGVSPWYWWADVPVIKNPNIYVKTGRYNLGEPKVQYRGIFLNDEEPALGRWAVENYGGFNHQFYEKVFELMLRLKGNYIWPAMWWASFNTDDSQNTQLADEMGIVMGTTHHEPMNRAHAEWKKDGKGEWNYEKNEAELKAFWKEGIERIENKEVIINMAMRGNGDEAMSEETNIALLEKIVSDQREIIANVTGKPTKETPQMWALYKEVQDYYDNGMRVPDDITLLLCDDNWGNIRKLPKPGSPERKGGYGIYYHFDYVGGPRNYKWLNTSPIPRVWEQMNLAYEHGVKKLWLVNVGDLKPMEYPITFWLDYAWNPELILANDLDAYTLKWAKEQFGEKYAAEIADLISGYTKFNGRRKPELLSANTYNISAFNEADNYIAQYNELVRKAQQIRAVLPDNYDDAFYQLVFHPIEACANLNELYVEHAKNILYAKQGRASANIHAENVKKLYQKDQGITNYYHTELANGKWNNMMNQVHIGYTYWQQPNVSKMPEVTYLNLENNSSMGMSGSGTDKWVPGDMNELVLPEFDPFHQQEYFIDVFNRGKKAFPFQVESGAKWLKVNPSSGEVFTEAKLSVSIDWENAPTGIHHVFIKIFGPNGEEQLAKAILKNPTTEEKQKIYGYFESNGFISIEAANFTKKTNGKNARWSEIPGLGRTLSAMHPVPVNSLAQIPGKDSPLLEYAIHLENDGIVNLQLNLSPTLNLYNDEGLELAVSLDDETPKIINIHENFTFLDWEEAVRNNTIFARSSFKVEKPGTHLLKIWMVDPGIVLEKIVLSTKPIPYTYLGPPQSVFVKQNQ